MPSMIGQDFDEGAEIGDAHDFTGIDAPDLGRLGQRFDALARSRFTGAIRGGDINRAVVIDVDLGAGLFLQSADVLAARANDGADFLNRDLDHGDAGCVRLQLRSRGRDDFQHFIQDERAGLFGLAEGHRP